MADDQEQPVAEEQEQPKARSGFFPKLLLWVLVIAFGYLYLGSLERNKSDEGAPATAVQPAPKPATEAKPAAPASAGATSAAQSQPATPGAAGRPSSGAATQAERQVSKTEAEAFAQALMDKQAKPTASKPAQPPPPQAPAQPSKPSAAAPVPQTSAAQSPTLPLPPPRMQPSAGAQSVAPAPSAAAEPASAGKAAEAEQPSAGQAQAPSPRALSARERVYERARIAAEYRELRRQAIEQARRRWYYSHAMPGPYPSPGYYGPPGYPMPGYPAPAQPQGQPSE